ncbi:MAG: hypothetical protein ACXADS_13960, partial [Candidatus Thorarchaeota archaeon]
LAPLSECTTLEELYLHSNHPEENEFTSLNLTPLFACKELEDLGVPNTSELRVDAALRNEKSLPPALEELKEDGRFTWD